MFQRQIASKLSLLLCLTRFAALGEIAFKPAQSYRVGTNPVCVVAGDFNQDGKHDLAVIDQGDPSVSDPGGISILLGNGDGTFQPAKNLAIGKNYTSAVAGDFDANGNDDLALVRPGDPNAGDGGDITIFLDNGDGTFQQGQVLALDAPPSTSNRSIVAADLNGDQRLDLIVATGTSFRVLLGNGNGTFQPPVVYAAFAPPPAAILLLDLTGNGKKDIALFGQLGVDIWLGNGDGTLRKASFLSDSSLRAAADFNGDKKDDLEVVSLSGAGVCIYSDCPGSNHANISYLLLGNGDGTFQPKIAGELGSGAGDLDGDGKMDLATNGNGQIWVSLGNGDGTFQSQIAFSINSIANPPQVLDVDGDGAPDLVIIGNDNIDLLVNVGTDFSISPSAPNPSTLSGGQTSTSSLALSLLSNFHNPISLTCSVQPAQPGAPTCSLSPSSVVFGADGKASATLSIDSASSVALRRDFRPLYAFLLPLIGFVLLGTMFGASEWRGRLRLTLLIVAVLFAGVIAQMACGGEPSAPKFVNYTVSVNATSGPTQHSATVTVQAQ